MRACVPCHAHSRQRDDAYADQLADKALAASLPPLLSLTPTSIVHKCASIHDMVVSCGTIRALKHRCLASVHSVILYLHFYILGFFGRRVTEVLFSSGTAAGLCMSSHMITRREDAGILSD